MHLEYVMSICHGAAARRDDRRMLYVLLLVMRCLLHMHEACVSRGAAHESIGQRGRKGAV